MTAKNPKSRRTPQRPVDFLLRHRRKIATTKWDALTPMFGSTREQILVEHDAELMAAIAAWRQRRLAEIDAQLRELGIDDVEGLEQAPAKVPEDHRARQIAVIEAALQPTAAYQMIVLA